MAVLGLSTTSWAQLADDGYSYTQPAAELVMPFDVTADSETFLLVSNTAGTSPGGVAQVSTHWIFWNENCDELVNFNVCLTLNDTVVINPRDMQAINAANESVGPRADLSGERGVVTVDAYYTDGACSGFRSTGAVLADDAIVGSFTIANVPSQSAYGNDALGLGLDANGNVVLPPANNFDVVNYDIQIFNPNLVEVSQVFLTRLRQGAGPTVRPWNGGPTLVLSTTFIDNLEIPTSLPDTRVPCVLVRNVQESGNDAGLIPEVVSVNSSGIVRLTPVSGHTPDDYVWGVKAEAIGSFGAASSVKATYAPGSASKAFLEAGMDLVD